MNDNVVSAPEADAAPAEAQKGIAEYSATEAGLAELRARLDSKVYDVTTTKGLDEARKDRAELRSLRVNLDKLRKKLNEDDQARIATRNGKAKEITAQIVALEDPIDAQIKRREEEQEAARKERERAEAERLRQINEEIDNLRRMPLDLINATAAEIDEGIKVLSTDTLDDFDEVHLPTAQAARDAALEQLRIMHSAKVTAEAEAERLAAERAELARLRDEQDRAIAQQAEDIRRQHEVAEQERRAQELVAEHIQDLKDIPASLAGRSSEILRSAIAEVEQIDPNDVRFGNRRVDADTAKVSTLSKLQGMLEASLAQEQQAAEQAERQRQLDAQAAEQKRQQEEADQRLREQQEREQAERDEAERAERARRVEAQRQRWADRQVAPGAAMSDQELDALCSLLMAADPSPINEEQRVALVDWADAESQRHGFTDWIDALHGLAHTGART